MPLKLTQIAKRVSEDSFSSVAREAVLRVSKQMRLLRFESQIGRTPEVIYSPIGYYKPVLQCASAEAREAIVRFADLVLRGEFPLMGYGNVALGSPVNWHSDWVSGMGWPLDLARSLTVVRHDGSDVKAPWELSRLQFLPVLAKASQLTEDEKYRAVAQGLVSDWIDRNPVGLGVNWTIAMEAALRAISICLTLELMWPLCHGEQEWLNKVTASLWQHLLFIEAHSEFSHFIRSNHYLSNIVGLATLSAALKGPGMDARFRHYAHAVQEEILLQNYGDGGDYEASTGYHVLVSQMFLHSYLVQKARGMAIDERFEKRLTSMFEWLAGLAAANGVVPQIGDCDDGRIELTLDDILQAAQPAEQRNSLRLANYLGLGSHILNKSFGGDGSDAVWFGAQSLSVPIRERLRVEVFSDSGLAVARSGEAELIFSAMPNGINGRGSHTHCDKLSFVLRLDGAEVFCDSGTACYTRDAQRRNWYRSTAAHNTITVDAQEQNVISHDNDDLFCCGNEAAMTPIVVREEGDSIAFSASHSGYGRLGVRCSRTVLLKAGQLVIEDEVQGSGSHRIDLFFQLGPEHYVATTVEKQGKTVACAIGGSRPLTLNCEAPQIMLLEVRKGEISRAYGSCLPTTRIHIGTTAQLPTTLVTHIEWNR